MVKLKILKVLATMGLHLLSINSKYKYPCKWLLHYLKGSGKDLEVNKEIVLEAKEAFINTIKYEEEDSSIYGTHCLYSSTLYNGKGFYNRPVLFYLVGGFSFNLEDNGTIKATDRYDWHSTDNGEYFTSPLGGGKFAKTVVSILGLIFGKEYFVVDAFPCYQHGISNKLWEDFKEIGAKEFNTNISYKNLFTYRDLCKIYGYRNREFLEREEIEYSPMPIDQLCLDNSILKEFLQYKHKGGLKPCLCRDLEDNIFVEVID